MYSSPKTLKTSFSVRAGCSLVESSRPCMPPESNLMLLRIRRLSVQLLRPHSATYRLCACCLRSLRCRRSEEISERRRRGASLGGNSPLELRRSGPSNHRRPPARPARDDNVDTAVDVPCSRSSGRMLEDEESTVERVHQRRLLVAGGGAMGSRHRFLESSIVRNKALRF